MTQTDVELLALELFRIAPGDWPTIVECHLEKSQAADLHRKRLDRLHPIWGNGGLASALVCSFSFAPPDKNSALFDAARLAVLHGILEWRTRQNVKWLGRRVPFSPDATSATLTGRGQGDADG